MVDLDDLGLYGKIEDGMVKVKNWSLVIFKEVKRNDLCHKAETVFDHIVEAFSAEPDST